MPTYRIFVADEEGGRSVEITQDMIDQNPVLKEIMERSFSPVDLADHDQTAYDQSYAQSLKPWHDKSHDNRTPGPYSKSYSRNIPTA